MCNTLRGPDLYDVPVYCVWVGCLQNCSSLCVVVVNFIVKTGAAALLRRIQYRVRVRYTACCCIHSKHSTAHSESQEEKREREKSNKEEDVAGTNVRIRIYIYCIARGRRSNYFHSWMTSPRTARPKVAQSSSHKS